MPSAELIPSLLTISDVLATGWFAAEAAAVAPGKTAVVVGDGAVGLLGVLSAKVMGAERIIAMSRHESRQKLAREFGATDIVSERGDEGIARIKDLTNGLSADRLIGRRLASRTSRRRGRRRISRWGRRRYKRVSAFVRPDVARGGGEDGHSCLSRDQPRFNGAASLPPQGGTD